MLSGPLTTWRTNPGVALSASLFEILDKQPFAREKPGDATSAEGYCWSRATDHDQAPRGGTPHQLVEIVNFVAEMMQTTAALQEFCDGGVGSCRFDQFDARITEMAWVDERYPHALQRIVPSF